MGVGWHNQEIQKIKAKRLFQDLVTLSGKVFWGFENSWQYYFQYAIKIIRSIGDLTVQRNKKFAWTLSCVFFLRCENTWTFLFQSSLSTRDNINMVRSAEELFRSRLPSIINTAVNLSPETVRSLFDQCVVTTKVLLALTLYVSVTGQQGVEQIYEQLMVSTNSTIS